MATSRSTIRKMEGPSRTMDIANTAGCEVPKLPGRLETTTLARHRHRTISPGPTTRDLRSRLNRSADRHRGWPRRCGPRTTNRWDGGTTVTTGPTKRKLARGPMPIADEFGASSADSTMRKERQAVASSASADSKRLKRLIKREGPINRPQELDRSIVGRSRTQFGSNPNRFRRSQSLPCRRRIVPLNRRG